MKYIEFFASALTLLGVWFISEQLYIIGFTLASVSCIVWVAWCFHFRFWWLLGLEGIMGVLYFKSLLGV